MIESISINNIAECIKRKGLQMKGKYEEEFTEYWNNCAMFVGRVLHACGIPAAQNPVPDRATQFNYIAALQLFGGIW